MKRISWLTIVFAGISLTACQKSPHTDSSMYYLFEDSLQISATEAWQHFLDGRFQKQTGHSFNPGFTISQYWLVVKRDTSQTTEPEQLEIGTPQINTIEFYSIENNHPEKKYVTGDHYAFTSRPEPFANFNFPLTSRSPYYLLKIDKRNESLQLTFITQPAPYFSNVAIQSTLVIGILTGIISLLLLFGFYLTIITREKLYSLYIMYVASGWLYVLSNTGFAYQYLWPGYPWFAGRARVLFTLITIGLSISFLSHYAGKPAYKWLRIALSSLRYFCYFLVCLLFLPGTGLKMNTLGYYFQELIAGLVGLYVLFIIITLTEKILKKNQMAVFYLLSITPIVFFSSLQLFYYSGGVDFSGSFLQHYGQATGYILEAIILTFGLAYRFNSYRLEKEQLLIRVNQQQVKYTRAIITTQENERRQIADQLHDVAGSLLSAAKLNLSSVREKNFIINPEAQVKLNTAEEAVTSISQMLRHLSHAISPVMLDKVGFRQAVEKIANIFNTSGKLKVEMEVTGFEKTLPEMMERYSVLYGILYELVNNIARHAAATHALVQLVEHDESIVLIVEDNGTGLNRSNAKASATHGLAAIQSKIHYLNGMIIFDDAQPHGLIVTIEIPKKNDEKNYPG